MSSPPSGVTLEAETSFGRALTARRWRLANGLGVISVVDRSAPIIAYQTWYRVGSRHELVGQTGMAHLFEHLMFNQTESLAPGDFDRVVERTGGESNAATWCDWTQYRLALPARELALAVRLEAERMSRLVLSPATVEPERDVVTNERRERVRRRPRPIASDRVLMGWKAVGQAHPDWAVLELLTTLLAGSPSGRLHRTLVIERELASSVDVQLTPFRDPSLLRVAVTCARGHRAEEAIAAIDGVIAALAADGPTASEMEKAKNLVETDFWASLVDAEGKAEALGHHETALGDFRSLFELGERLAAVTAEDLKRAIATYLVAEARTTIIAEPDGSATEAAGDEDEDVDGDVDGDGDVDEGVDSDSDSAPAAGPHSDPGARALRGARS